MKILMTSQGVPNAKYPMNGIHQFPYAKALVERGINVFMLSFDTRSFLRLRKPGFTRGTYQGVPYLNYNLFQQTRDYKKAGDRQVQAMGKVFKKVQEEFKFDLIHSHTFETTYPLLSWLEDDTPLVVTEHFSAVNKERKEEINPGIYKMARKVYDRADLLTIASKEFKRRIEKNFSVKAEILPILTHDKLFQIGYNKRKNFTFVCTGNLKKEKGQRDLLKAFQKTFKEKPVDLLFIGSGEDEKYLRNFIKEKNMTNAHLLGQKTQEEIAEIYKSAHAFALVSHHETYGKAYVEAMAAGLPILTVNNGGSEAFVKDFTGIQAVKKDVDSIGNGLLKITKNYDKFNPTEIRKFEQENFSEEEIVKKIITYYKILEVR